MAAATSIMLAQQIVLARVDEALKPFELTFARYEALVLLSFSRNGSLPLGKMGERLMIHPTSVTNIVDRHEAQGLVRRLDHPTDRRTTLCEITDGEGGRRQGDGSRHSGRPRHLRPRRPRDRPSDEAAGQAPARRAATSRLDQMTRCMRSLTLRSVGCSHWRPTPRSSQAGHSASYRRTGTQSSRPSRPLRSERRGPSVGLPPAVDPSTRQAGNLRLGADETHRLDPESATHASVRPTLQEVSPSQSSRDRRPRDRRQQILDAARDLFVERGYPNVSMASIADRVHITAAALYRHFSGKADLLEQVVAESFLWLDSLTARDNLDQAIDDAIQAIIGLDYLSDLWIHEIRYLPADATSDLRDRMRDWTKSLSEPLQAERDDLDSGQVELLVSAIQSALSGLGRRAIHAPRTARLAVVCHAVQAIRHARVVPTGETAPPPARRLEPASTRERLLLAAAEQFGCAQGYHNTSVASIGAAVGVTGASLYEYFESKSDVLRAVYARGTHALWLSLNDALVHADSADTALRSVIKSYVKLSSSWAATLDDPTVVVQLAEVARAEQREYVGEWVELLIGAKPELAGQEAKLRVQMGLFIVSDLLRNARIASRGSFEKNLASLVTDVVLGPART